MKKYRAYVCGVDWQHELGESPCEVFPMEKILKANKSCWRKCGIVEVEIRLKRWTRKQKMAETKASAKPKPVKPARRR